MSSQRCLFRAVRNLLWKLQSVIAGSAREVNLAVSLNALIRSPSSLIPMGLSVGDGHVQSALPSGPAPPHLAVGLWSGHHATPHCLAASTAHSPPGASSEWNRRRTPEQCALPSFPFLNSIEPDGPELCVLWPPSEAPAVRLAICLPLQRGQPPLVMSLAF